MIAMNAGRWPGEHATVRSVVILAPSPLRFIDAAVFSDGAVAIFDARVTDRRRYVAKIGAGEAGTAVPRSTKGEPRRCRHSTRSRSNASNCSTS